MQSEPTARYYTNVISQSISGLPQYSVFTAQHLCNGHTVMYFKLPTNCLASTRSSCSPYKWWALKMKWLLDGGNLGTMDITHCNGMPCRVLLSLSSLGASSALCPSASSSLRRSYPRHPCHGKAPVCPHQQRIKASSHQVQATRRPCSPATPLQQV